MFPLVFHFIAFTTLLSLVSANSIQVNNADFSQPYELCWYPDNSFGYTWKDEHGQVHHGHEPIRTPVFMPRTSQYVKLPVSWIGSIHAVHAGGGEAACDRPTVIAEVTFQGYEGLTWYDVSAVDNCCDDTGVHFLLPEFCKEPVSGCWNFPCENDYFKSPGNGTPHFTGCLDLILLIGNSPLGWSKLFLYRNIFKS
jgi:hypothetical protein